ncbi:MAG: hypothetical protein U1E73_13635 [Planctomycetota bacterium]
MVREVGARVAGLPGAGPRGGGARGADRGEARSLFPTADGAGGANGGGSSRWALRIFVLSAFAATVWLAGPRAVDVLAARYQQLTEQSPAVDLDRVAFLHQPTWLDRPLLLAIAKDIGPELQASIAILDEVAARRLQEQLGRSPWVRGAALTKQLPDRFRVEIDLRRPVLEVQDGDGVPLCLVDAEGVALSHVAAGLPFVRLYREGGNPTLRTVAGTRIGEPRVLAAVGIAVEWRDQMVPLVPEAPKLLEVDATNLGEHWMQGRSYPEIRVALERDDGQPVIFFYGRPVDTALPRVPIATKAGVLAKILAAHPKLAGLIAGDLRLKNRWADYLQPRAASAPDPDGPWSDLDRAGGR